MAPRAYRLAASRRFLLSPLSLGVLALSLVVLVIRVTAAPGPSSGGSSAPRAATVEEAIHELFDVTRCTSAEAARLGLTARLTPGEWVVADATALRPDQCVAARLDVDRRRVELIPALSPEVRARMQEVTQDLIARCLGRDDAVKYVTTVLEDLREVDFEVRTDGPLTAPIDQLEEVQAHVRDGCWVYSGTGWDRHGHRFYYVTGLS